MVEVHVRTRVFVAVQQCCSAVVDLERSLGLVQLHFAGLVATAVIVLVAGLALVLTCRVGLRLVEVQQAYRRRAMVLLAGAEVPVRSSRLGCRQASFRMRCLGQAIAFLRNMATLVIDQPTTVDCSGRSMECSYPSARRRHSFLCLSVMALDTVVRLV